MVMLISVVMMINGKYIFCLVNKLMFFVCLAGGLNLIGFSLFFIYISNLHKQKIFSDFSPVHYLIFFKDFLIALFIFRFFFWKKNLS